MAKKKSADKEELEDKGLTEMLVGTPETSAGTWAFIGDQPEAAELPPPRGAPLFESTSGSTTPMSLPKGQRGTASQEEMWNAIQAQFGTPGGGLRTTPTVPAGDPRGFPAPNPRGLRTVDSSDPSVVRARAEDRAARAGSRATTRGTSTRGAAALRINEALEAQGINLPNLEVPSGLTTAEMLTHYRTDPSTGRVTKVTFEESPDEKRMTRGARGELTAYPPPGAVPVTTIRSIPTYIPSQNVPRPGRRSSREEGEGRVEYRESIESTRRPIGTVSSGPRGAKSARFARRQRPEAEFAEPGSARAKFLKRSQEGSPAERGSPVVNEEFIEYAESGETRAERDLARWRKDGERRRGGGRTTRITPEDMMKMYIKRREKEAYWTTFGTRGRPTYAQARAEYNEKATPEGIIASREGAESVDPEFKYSETPSEVLSQISSGEWRAMGAHMEHQEFITRALKSLLNPDLGVKEGERDESGLIVVKKPRVTRPAELPAANERAEVRGGTEARVASPEEIAEMDTAKVEERKQREAAFTATPFGQRMQANIQAERARMDRAQAEAAQREAMRQTVEAAGNRVGPAPRNETLERLRAQGKRRSE